MREDYCIHGFAPRVHCPICDEERSKEERQKVSLERDDDKNQAIT